MLARKLEYMHYESARTIPAGQMKIAERYFMRHIMRTLTIVGLIGFFLLAYIALSAAKTNYSYTLMQEKRQVQQLQRENDNLRVDIAKLETPERVYTTATKNLGMVAPAYVLYGPSKKQTAAEYKGR